MPALEYLVFVSLMFGAAFVYLLARWFARPSRTAQELLSSAQKAHPGCVEGSLEAPPIVIRTDPKRATRTLRRLVWLFLPLALILIAIALRSPQASRAYLVASFVIPAGLYAILASVMTLGGPDRHRMELSPEGLIYRMSENDERRWPWRDVHRFFGISASGGTIQFRVGDPGSPEVFLLPVAWPMDPESLADLLNDARDRWGGASA